MRKREIGPIGTTSRAIAGIIAVALPVALDGGGWWEALALPGLVLVATAAAALIVPAFERFAPGSCSGRGGICGAPGCALIAVLFGTVVGISALTPVNGDVAFWAFVGASMLLTAASGDGGCELLAFPNALTGRRDRIGCILFTPIDAAEARRRTRALGFAREG